MEERRGTYEHFRQALCPFPSSCLLAVPSITRCRETYQSYAYSGDIWTGGAV
jgi:hypothetical protein